MKRLLAAIAALTIAAPAALAATPTLKVSPSKVAQGHKLKVYGSVAACSGSVTLYSTAFKGSTKKQFAGVPAVYAKVDRKGNFSKKVKIQSSTKTGKYSVGGRCGGGNIGSVTFKVKKPSSGGGPGFY